MNTWVDLFLSVCTCLRNAGIRYCVLRMPTESAEDHRPGDIDILVHRDDLGALYDVLAASFDLDRLFYIQTHAQLPLHDRAGQYCIKIDVHAVVFVGMSGGMFRLPIENDVLQSRILDDQGIPRPAPAYDLLLLALHTLLDKASIKQDRLPGLFSLFLRYNVEKLEILSVWENYLGTKNAHALWQALEQRQMKEFVAFRKECFRYFFTREHAYLKSLMDIAKAQVRARSYLWFWPLRKPITVALVGPDGTGKSTIAHALSKFPGVSSTYMGNAGAVLSSTRWIKKIAGRKTSKKNRSNESGDSPPTLPKNRKNGKNRLINSVKERITRPAIQNHYFLEFVARYLYAVAEPSLQVAVFDRYVYDHCIVLSDQPTTAMQYLRSLAYTHIFPAPDILVHMKAPPDILYERKYEQSVEHLTELAFAYQKFIQNNLEKSSTIIYELSTDRAFTETLHLLSRMIEKERLKAIGDFL